MGCPSILTCNVAVVTHRVALERFVIYVACLSCAEGQPVLSCHPRLVGFARQCPTLAVWALRLGGVVFQRLHQNSYPGRCSRELGWLVGCFGFNGPLIQYFSLYRAVSQRAERGEKMTDESKNVVTTPTRTYYKRSRPLPYCNPNCRTPQHWQFTQHHRTTRPLPRTRRNKGRAILVG